MILILLANIFVKCRISMTFMVMCGLRPIMLKCEDRSSNIVWW